MWPPNQGNHTGLPLYNGVIKMTERRKDLLALALLLAVLIGAFSHILFTDKIIRAPDILNEHYWAVKDLHSIRFFDIFRIDLSSAGWSIFFNSGDTTEGGGASMQFLFYHRLIYWLIPSPANVAWFIVFHLFFGAVGTFLYCRAIGAGRAAAFLGGLIFACATENASLINAGHVLKIATISYAPLAFYFLEKGFQGRRLFFFLATAFTLAFQFFNYHWQIAFYTCLAIGIYGILRSLGIIFAERERSGKGIGRLLLLNLATLCFFLTTVAISLLPLASWSVETNRGAQSGANQGKGGLQIDEAMSWSLPPEELATFVIPGFFGLSRQEGGENPSNIASYYWGRMHFTQTADYMGLLPWLLLPLPLIFRRDRYTWLGLLAVAGGITFSMGKYSIFYQFLFDYFPGINRFRVPKMMMFIPVFGLGVLAARGVDILLDKECRADRKFRYYLLSLVALPLLLLLLVGIELAGKERWIGSFYDMLSQPTRYEQGPQLIAQRWNNIVSETGIAAVVAAVYAAVFVVSARSRRMLKALPFLLLFLYLADVGRVNAKFMFLVDVPQKSKGIKTPVIEYLSRQPKEYRVLPLSADPNQYATNGIPVMFTSMPVQQRRWQEILDIFSFNSALPDMLNVKYLVYDANQYQQEKAQLGDKYVPVFTSPDGSEVVVENRRVLPKAWLVPSVLPVSDRQQGLAILQNPSFDPRAIALVESPAPIPMPAPNMQPPVAVGGVAVTHYEGDKISFTANPAQNAILVVGEKFYKGWRATVDGKDADIYPVDHVLRGIYLTAGSHAVEMRFDPLPFKVGKYLTLASFAFFAMVVGRELYLWRKRVKGER